MGNETEPWFFDCMEIEVPEHHAFNERWAQSATINIFESNHRGERRLVKSILIKIPCGEELAEVVGGIWHLGVKS